MNNASKAKKGVIKKTGAPRAAGGRKPKTPEKLATKFLRIRKDVHKLILEEQQRINAVLGLEPHWNLEDIAHQAIITWLQEPQRLERVYREKNEKFFEVAVSKLT